jgi:hypothetical protein
MVQLGSGGKRELKDYFLSRFACYLSAPSIRKMVEERRRTAKRRLHPAARTLTHLPLSIQLTTI